jgi:hypothetical protein
MKVGDNMLLSEITYQQYELLKQNHNFWDQKITEILKQEKFTLGNLSRFPFGANIVYSYEGEYVIKL